MKIITFSGVDGSGKSTQTGLLKEHLESLGKKVVYFHATEFSLANRLARKIKGQKEPFVPGSAKAVSKASFSSVLVRLMFIMADALRFERYRIKQERGGVDYMVSDRFFQDSLINALYLSDNPVTENLVKGIAAALPVPDQCFYLQVTSDEVLARTRVPEQGVEYLKEKIDLYNDPIFEWEKTILAGNQNADTLHQEVQNMITPLI
jgi:thymidylate kinase